MMAPATITAAGIKRVENCLTRALFTHAHGKADIKYFQREIHAWVKTPPHMRSRTFTALVFDLSLRRVHYCFFSNREGRLLPSEKFTDWARRTVNSIEAILIKANA